MMKEFIFPKNFALKNDLSPKELKVKNVISLPNNNKRGIYKNPFSYDYVINTNLKIKESNKLISMFNCDFKEYKLEKNYTGNPEVEFKIEASTPSKQLASASFLFDSIRKISKIKKKDKAVAQKFNCIDYMFASTNAGGLYLLPLRPTKGIDLKKVFFDIDFYSNTEGLKESKRYFINGENRGIFIDYSFIPKYCSHYIVSSDFPWITYSINLTQNAISMEHTLFYKYFRK